jgi:hypothetical protein
MRQILLRAAGALGPVPARLEQSEAVWEQAYAEVMTLTPDRPLYVFWLHYYGVSAEMHFDTPALLELQQDLHAMLRGQVVSSPAARSFLRRLKHLCDRAIREGGSLEVIAD